MGQMIGRAPVFDTGAISNNSNIFLFFLMCLQDLNIFKPTPFHFVQEIF